MVIFDNHIILFSDKHCAFPDHADITIAWRRWYRRAIEESVDQLFGAEAWLRRFSNRVFLDRKCSQRFPFSIPSGRDARFHRIAVTRGAYDRCREFYGGVSTGSLCINTGIQGREHYGTPFSVGEIASERGYVHVLDELTLEVVLRELDTISDLVGYLERKEELLSKSGRMIWASGEEQLVATYLTNTNSDGRHDFGGVPDDAPFAMFSEGQWEDFVKDPQYKAKKEADEISYTWDRLIEHFITHRNDAIGESSPNGLPELEMALRVLASESRLSRRALSKFLVEAMEKRVTPGHRFTRVGTSKQCPDTGYVFLIYPKPDYVRTYEEFRQGRKVTLLALCKVAKLELPAAQRVVGFATEPLGTYGASEDLLLLDTSREAWNEVAEEEARELREKFGFLNHESLTRRESHDKEYPSTFHPRQVVDRAERRRLEREEKRVAKCRRTH